MSASGEIDPKSSLWAWLAHDLRFHREKHGLSGTQLGKIIGCVRSTVSNLEAGRYRLDDKQARALDKEWNTGGHFERLLWFAQTAHDPDWFRTYTQYEADASVIRIYQGQVVPGPLQTEQYTRALLLASNAKDIDAAVAARMGRQDTILNRSDTFVWVLLDEGVLDYEIGGSGVMKGQYLRLLELGKLPHVSIRFVPKAAGAHLGLDGPFRIISLESRDVAYVGAQHGGRLVEAIAEVRELRVDYDRIGIKASSEDASEELIERLLEA
jgi:hypothetical protein